VSKRATGQPVATREAWLNLAASRMRPWFAQHSLTVPTTVHVSVGWPSRSALSRTKQRLGECWYGETSSDGAPHLFISPLIADSVRVLDVLLHELLHTALPGAKHGPKFAKFAKLLGLDGKPSATVASEELGERLREVVKEIGPMPHAGLKVAANLKRQSTRMLKLTATECCGYSVRTTRKWIDDEGLPLCPHGNEMELG
jgi:hypothetical protein